MDKMAGKLCMGLICLLSIVLLNMGCGEQEAIITALSQLEDKTFAVPTGTVTDQLVLAVFPDAKFKYFNSALDCALAVKSGQVAAAAYDEPILRNIAAKIPELTVLPDMITDDDYGFAVKPENHELKETIDSVIADLHNSGMYDDMMERWLPEEGDPAPMPHIELTGTKGVLTLGTAAVTEPFSFIDGTQSVTGFDIEIARYIAQALDMELEVVNMDFGGLIPALIAGKVDVIAACITITEERANRVLFSEPYYTGGIAALVRE